jgi:hypothetical protein
VLWERDLDETINVLARLRVTVGVDRIFMARPRKLSKHSGINDDRQTIYPDGITPGSSKQGRVGYQHRVLAKMANCKHEGMSSEWRAGSSQPRVLSEVL